MTDETPEAREMRSNLATSKTTARDELDAMNAPDLAACPDCGSELCTGDHTDLATQETEHARRVEAAYNSERARRDARRRLADDDRGQVDPPELVTLRDRLAQPVTVTPFRIEALQPEGSRVICAAQFKAGKTTIVGNLIRSLADGDPFLDRYHVGPIAGTVALLDFEMSAGQLSAWLRDQQIRRTDRVVVAALRGQARCFDVRDERIRAEWITRLAGVSYLIVDCVRPILDAVGLDEHRETGAFLAGLDSLLTEAGIGECLAIHHMGHTGERSRGDSRLRDWPDVEWRLVRQNDDPASDRFFSAYGRDVDMPEARLLYDAPSRRLTITDGSRRDQVVIDVLGDVLITLDRASEPQSARAIQTALGDTEHTRASVRSAIKQGISEGAITTEAGPRNAILHRRNIECATSEPAQSAHSPSDSASECANPFRGWHTRAVTEGAQETGNEGADKRRTQLPVDPSSVNAIPPTVTRSPDDPVKDDDLEGDEVVF